MKKVDRERGIIFLLAILVIGLLAYIIWSNEKDQEVAETAETEEVQLPREPKASKKLEEDLKGLKNSETKVETEVKIKVEKSNTSKNSVAKPVSSNIQGSIFNYEGKPDLSFTQYDFGIYLTPVTQGSNTYVPIKFISKEYIRKLAPEVSGLKPNTIPMTDMANPKGRPAGKKWRLDKSGKVYYFVDFGQKVKKSKGSTAQIPLNAYAGQKPGGHQIWLMYEAAVLNKVGFTQYWNNGKFISNGDGGYDYAGYFTGYERL